jgi:hypothetical protein
LQPQVIDHDTGKFSGKWNDYHSDAAARAGEKEIANTLPGPQWEDPNFPANGDSLYKNQHAPPRGALPPDSVEWNRINQGEVTGCENPELFPGGAVTCDVVQGALGDCWFIGALSIVGTREKLVKALLVSEQYKDRGIYTLKISKTGKWRYVHVDDRVPCNRSGHPHYARGKNVNEIWIMLVEKAYAKLHGCYENLRGGSIDHGLRDLTGGATCKFKLDSPKTRGLVESGALWARLKGWKGEGETWVTQTRHSPARSSVTH